MAGPVSGGRAEGPPGGPFGADGVGARLVEELVRLVDVLAAMPRDHEAETCRGCPLCRGMAALRDLRPEVVDHLAAAGEELLAAAREFSTPEASGPSGPGSGAPPAPARPPVQPIEITD